MAKRNINSADIQVGKLVAFNMLPDATWWRVVSISGFVLAVQEIGYDDIQTIDISFVQQVKD
jgi:ABC-type bacteriocin/lantibiotic exporter with double-glycine peptidase domain